MQVLCYQFSCRVMQFRRLFSSSPSALTSCCFCIPHVCVHFFSSMLLAPVYHPDFMAHDVSAPRLDESGFRAADGNISARFVQCSRSVPLSAFCTLGWCAHRLLYKELLLTDATCENLLALFAPGCDHGSAGKFRWLASSKEPALFFKAM